MFYYWLNAERMRRAEQQFAQNRALETLRHHVTGAIERGEAEAITEVPAVPARHPDLEATCRTCGFRAYEHDPVDMRCPDDEDEAAINAQEG